MGLSISRSIVEAHGGCLWTTANPDRGTTFRFTLPVRAARRDQSRMTVRLAAGLV
jgi:signal transduction histidine kinase